MLATNTVASLAVFLLVHYKLPLLAQKYDAWPVLSYSVAGCISHVCCWIEDELMLTVCGNVKQARPECWFCRHYGTSVLKCMVICMHDETTDSMQERIIGYQCQLNEASLAAVPYLSLEYSLGRSISDVKLCMKYIRRMMRCIAGQTLSKK